MSSASYMESPITFTPGSAETMILVASTPLIRGMLMSMMTTSGLSSARVPSPKRLLITCRAGDRRFAALKVSAGSSKALFDPSW